MSNEKAKIAHFCLFARDKINESPSKYEWVQLYSNPNMNTALLFIAARFPKNKQEHFLDENARRQEKLKEHIARKVTKKPLMTSSFLMEHGIMPGKKLGKLLEKSEEIAIEKNLHNPEDILKILHKDPLWGS